MPSGPQPSETFTPEQLEAANTVIEFFHVLDGVLSDPDAETQSLVNITMGPWCQVVEATSRRSYASRGVSHPKAALGRSLSSSAMAPVVGLVCGDLGAFG